MGKAWRRSGIALERVIAGLLRVASLTCVALVVGGIAWTAASPPVGLAAVSQPERASPLGRMRAPAPALDAAVLPGLVEPAPITLLAPNAVVRVVRIAELEVTERGEIPFAVRRIANPALELGIERVLAPGRPGEVLRTFAVRTVDGVEAERTLVSETSESEPVTEVRVVGTRPRPVPPAPGEIAAIVRAAAEKWGADPDTLLRVAWCESRYNPSAYNYASGASGLFQFMPATFARNSVRAGLGDASVWDPVANANTAAFMFAAGQARQWACK